MYALICMLIMWMVGIVGIWVMRKIQPEDNIYPIWVVFVCIAITCFVIYYESYVLIRLKENLIRPTGCYVSHHSML